MSPGQDRGDHVGLGIGVLLQVAPIVGGQLAFRAGIEVTVRWVVSQPITEAHHPVSLWTPAAEHVHVDVLVRALEQTVFKPLRLPDPQHVPRRLKTRAIGRLIR